MNHAVMGRKVGRTSRFAQVRSALARVFAGVALVLGGACGTSDTADRSAPAAAPPAMRADAPRAQLPPITSSPAAASEGFGPAVGFRSRARLDEHFAKHGSEFGTITREQYLAGAQHLRDAPVGGDVLELARSDGSVSRFDRQTGSFIAFDADGVIRTYFRPNDGEAYFRRQARRRPDR